MIFIARKVMMGMNQEEKDYTTEDMSTNSSADTTTEATAQYALLKEQLLRVSADFQNYQQRVTRERVEWVKQAQSDILKSLLTLADDFDRALSAHTEGVQTLDTALRDGVIMMQGTLSKILSSYGVKKIEQVSVFDPYIHEAIAHIQDPSKQAGAIVSVVEPGYLLGDKVLRPARVVVAG